MQEIKLRLYREGKVSFYATDLEELSKKGIPYTKADVFYNPDMKVNRDISVAVNSILKGDGKSTAIDMMAATGVRSIRWAVESNSDKVWANDKNPIAVHIIRKNIMLNNVEDKVKVTCRDAGMLASELREIGIKFWYVDLDPFGSPAPYIRDSLKIVRKGGILAVTATDTAPLFGVYPMKLFRYYRVLGIRTHFHKEFGIRALIYFILMEAALRDLIAIPLLAYSHLHYVRAYFLIERGALKFSRIAEENLGWVNYCECGNWSIKRSVELPERDICNLCGSRMRLMGPIWIGLYKNKEFVDKVMEFAPSEESKNVLKGIAEELDIPFYHNLDLISKKLKISSPGVSKVIEKLKERGFSASRSHAEPKAVKTNADLAEIIKILS
ncbi:MAG: tRNA (guanine(10)-N(2))-dimethyltransferase [Candidatus Methanodesulfokora sp.]